MDSALIRILQGKKHGAITIRSRADGAPGRLGTAICQALSDVVIYPISSYGDLSPEVKHFRFAVEGELPMVLIHRLMKVWDQEHQETYQYRGEDRIITYNPAVANFQVFGGDTSNYARADVIYTITSREAVVDGMATPADRAKHRGPGKVLIPKRPHVRMEWSGGEVVFEGWPEDWLKQHPESEGD